MSETANKEDYLKELQRWQACSHPDLADRKAAQLFESSFVERYDRLHEDLWRRIIRAHGTLYTLGQLRSFPFDYLYAPNNMEFWRLVIENFLDMACLLLHCLVGDAVPNAHTIPKFRNEIMAAPWLDDSKRELLRQTLADRKFDGVVDRIGERVGEIRHQRIAHRLRDNEAGCLKDQLPRVTLDELGKLFDATHSMFGALSFGSAYVTLVGDLTPATVGGKPTRTCLDDVLNAVIRDSPVVNQPERNAWWSELRKHRSTEQLETLNRLRKRVGLPEA